MKKLGLFVLFAVSFIPHARAQGTLEKCQTGACYGFGAPSGQAQNGFIYQDVSQSPPALYCPKNGAWVPCGGSSSGSSLPNTVFVTVAASNSVNKAAAQFVATGANDQTTINTAIASCPATLPASPGPAQCTVMLMPGVYNISGSVLIDQDDITLTGEGHCMWGGYNHVWTSTASPQAAIGTGCSQLRASATGFPLIQVNHANAGGTGSADTDRHRGLSFKWLYLVGNAYGNTGILDTNGTIEGDDNVTIIDNVFQRLNVSMNLRLDTPDIELNSCQDNSGDCLVLGFFFGHVTNNLFFDIGGKCFNISSPGVTVANNLCGNTQDVGILATGTGEVITGNKFIGNVGGAIKLVGASNSTITGNNDDLFTPVDYNTGINGFFPNSADGISVDATSTGVAITGNTISGLNPSVGVQTGFAIRDLGTNGMVAGNDVTQSWNGGGIPISIAVSNQTIQDSGAGNAVAFGNASNPGIRYFSKDVDNSNLPSLSIADGTGTGIVLDTRNNVYGIPTLNLGLNANGGAVDLFTFRSWRADNVGGMTFYTANGATSAALPRMAFTGNANTSAINITNATLNLPDVNISNTATITSTSSTPVSVSSNNTQGTNFVLINTSTGGHSFNLFSTGSASGAAGSVGAYDNTAAQMMYYSDHGSGALGVPLGMFHSGSYMETLTTPATSSAACIAGQFTDDASFHYVCTATNTWKRAALTAF